jgi:hypothetical protein
MSELSSGWSRQFDEPIALPDGGKLISVRDAANYITALPAKEAASPEWWVADLGGPTMLARIGVMRALNRHHVREFKQSGKNSIGGAASRRETRYETR